MQSFDTESDHTKAIDSRGETSSNASPPQISSGAGVRIELPGGDEVAVFNVGGEYYAIDNFCPHKGAPLSEGLLCDHIIECSLHGWQFDVRTGECLTVPERIRTYKVVNENGIVKIEEQQQ